MPVTKNDPYLSFAKKVVEEDMEVFVTLNGSDIGTFTAKTSVEKKHVEVIQK